MPVLKVTDAEARQLKELLRRSKRADAAPREAPRDRTGDKAPTPIFWQKVKNVHATEAVPPHGVMMPINGAWITGQAGFLVTKPDWPTEVDSNSTKRFEPPYYLINWDREIPPGKTGWGAIEGPMPALLNGFGWGNSGSGPFQDNLSPPADPVSMGSAGWKARGTRFVNAQPSPFTVNDYDVGLAPLASGALSQNYCALLTPQRGQWGLSYVSQESPSPPGRHVSRTAFVAAGPAWTISSGPPKQFAYVMRRQASAESFVWRDYSISSVGVGSNQKLTTGMGGARGGRNEESGSTGYSTAALFVTPSGQYAIALSVEATLSGAATFTLKTSVGVALCLVNGTGTIPTPVKQTMATATVARINDGSLLDVYADVTGAAATTVRINIAIHRLGS